MYRPTCGPYTYKIQINYMASYNVYCAGNNYSIMQGEDD
jgi:hypothetical protein